MKSRTVLAGALLLLAACLPAAGQDDKRNKFPLDIRIAGAGIVSGPELECSKFCTIEMEAGRTVELLATPASEWTFLGWDGACTGKTKCMLTMDHRQSVIAIFTYP